MNRSEAEAKVNVLPQGSSRRSQQGIADLVTKKTKSIVRRDVPGGDTFVENVDVKNLPLIILNQLKGSSKWTRFELSMVGPFDDISQLTTLFPKAVRRNEHILRVANPNWMYVGEGLRTVSNIVAKVFSETEHLLCIIVDEKGVSYYVDSEGVFNAENEKWHLIVQYHVD